MTLLLSETVNGVLRTFHAHAAYDTRGQKPDYGRHGMEFIFTVASYEAAVEVLWMTGWELPTSRNDNPPRYPFAGLGQISSHSPVALYPDHSPSSHECEFTGGVCYINTSYLDSGDLFDKFTADPAALWQELERRLTDLEAEIETERANARNL